MNAFEASNMTMREVIKPLSGWPGEFEKCLLAGKLEHFLNSTVILVVFNLINLKINLITNPRTF